MTQPPVAYPCYRHPATATYIRCQRCGRPICGECMISAAVGFQCPECVSQGAKQTRQNEAPYGGQRSTNPSLTTIVLIAINALVWGAISLTGGALSRLVDTLALLPLGRCLSVQDTNRYYPDVGANACRLMGDGAWQPGVAEGAYWQLLTSAFTHIEVLHIGMNMLALWFLGPSLERALGRVRFLAVYLLAALAGSVVVLWLADTSATTLGASGGVFGLIGALLVLAYKVHGDVRSVLVWLGINVVYTFVGGSSISWQGHLGGLIGGALAALIVVYAPKQGRTRLQLLGLAGLTVILLVLTAVRVTQLN
jgi:membrane associated rhomboid family serine protease